MNTKKTAGLYDINGNLGGSRRGGGGGDMEARVTKLESDVSDIKTNVALLINKIDNMAESISKLPTAVVMQCKFELVENKLTELSDKVSKRPNEDKLNTKFVEVNSKIELSAEKTEIKIKDVRLQIILWILGLPSVIFGVYKLYQALTIIQ